MLRLAPLLLLLLPALVYGVVWVEMGDAPPASAPASSAEVAQSMLGADPLTGISGTLPTSTDVDTFTFVARANSLTLSMTSFAATTALPQDNDAVTPALFLFSVGGTVASPTYTAMVASRRALGTDALPVITISTPVDGRFMLAVSRNRVVPRNAANTQNMWTDIYGTLLNTPAGVSASCPSTCDSGVLGGWGPAINPSISSRMYMISVTYTFAPAAPGFVFGDPHFKGYKNQLFDFQGSPGLAYQLYSDANLALNIQMVSWVGPTSKVAPNSTVIGHARLLFGSSFLEVSAASFNQSTGSLVIRTHTGDKVLDSAAALDFDCASVQWDNSKKLLVWYRNYELRVSWGYRAYNHGWFLNVELDVPKALLLADSPQGGLLGQTLVHGPPSLSAELFLVSSLAAADAKTNRFQKSQHVATPCA